MLCATWARARAEALMKRDAHAADIVEGTEQREAQPSTLDV